MIAPNSYKPGSIEIRRSNLDDDDEIFMQMGGGFAVLLEQDKFIDAIHEIFPDGVPKKSRKACGGDELEFKDPARRSTVRYTLQHADVDAHGKVTVTYPHENGFVFTVVKLDNMMHADGTRIA